MSIHPDGSGETRLVLDPFGVMSPSFGADGQSLAYASLLGINITNANGGSPVSVTGTATLNDFDFR